MLGNVGPLEILVVLIIALVVFGPKRLPELGNSLGKGIREFRDTVTGEKSDDDDVDDSAAKTLSASQATPAPAPVQPAAAPVEPPPAPVDPPVEAEVVNDKPS